MSFTGRDIVVPRVRPHCDPTAGRPTRKPGYIPIHKRTLVSIIEIPAGQEIPGVGSKLGRPRNGRQLIRIAETPQERQKRYDQEHEVQNQKRASFANQTPAQPEPKPRESNVTTLIDHLKASQAKADERAEKKANHKAPREPRTETHESRRFSSAAPTPNAARSFLVPDLTIMNDFVSGTLRLSTMRNGVPIFVKNGKVHDRDVSAGTPAKHHAVESVAVPQDEEEIFVSLDKLREEIGTLQEHDARVSEQAENLQSETKQLALEIHDLKAQLSGTEREPRVGASVAAEIKHLKQEKSSK